MVPTDGSEENNVVIKKGFSMAKLLDVGMKIIFVVDTAPISQIPPDDLITSLESYMEKEGKKVLDRIEEEAKEEGIEIEKMIKQGHPSDVIAEESKEDDLIVMGTHSRTGLSRLFMGSTADKVIRKSNCPVMVIRIKEEDTR